MPSIVISAELLPEAVCTRAQMNVLDAGIVHQHLAAEENSPAHGDPVVGELVPHRVVAEIQHDDDDGEQWQHRERYQDVVLPQRRIRTRDSLNLPIKGGVGHGGERSGRAQVGQGN
jgi:hypothetical protein